MTRTVFDVPFADSFSILRRDPVDECSGFGVTVGVKVIPVHALRELGFLRLYLNRKHQITRKEYFVGDVYDVTELYSDWLTAADHEPYWPTNIYHDKKDDLLFAELGSNEDESLVGFIVCKSDLYDPKSKARAMGKRVDHKVLVESSTGKKAWEVLIYDDKSMSCSCPAWRFSKANPRTCKHIKKVEKEGIRT